MRQLSLSGIVGNTFGRRISIRGYANYYTIVKYSFPDPSYQRNQEDPHVEEIKKFILDSDNSFSPEVILGFTLSSDLSSNTHESSSLIENLWQKKTCTFSNSNKTIKIKYSTTKNECTISFSSEKPLFRRIDGNHRLLALQEIIKEKHPLESYVLPFCIILFEDNDSSKQDEKIIFYNINTKAVPVQTEHMLKGIIPEKVLSPFNDDELVRFFGIEHLAVRKIEQNYPMLIETLKQIEWASDNTRSLLLHLVQYAANNENRDLFQPLEQNHIAYSILQSLEKINNICGKNTCYSGVLFVLTKLFFRASHTTGEPETTIDCFIEWAKRNDLFSIQPNISTNWEINADNILIFFDKHLKMQRFSIFLSRCFSDEYNEIDNTITRAINEINQQFSTQIELIHGNGDNEGSSRDILSLIIEKITSCGLVIADLSSGKPNIPHEIGLAMGMKKPIILLHRGKDEQDLKDHIPSNLNMIEQIRFDTHDYNYLEKAIKQRLINHYIQHKINS